MGVFCRIRRIRHHIDTEVLFLAVRHQAIRRLTESAILVALGFVLSYVRVKFLPYGGSITCLSMLPILLVGYRHGLSWGLGAGVVYGLLQALQEGSLAPPSSGLAEYFGMMALDYVLAFGVLSLSALFREKKNGLVYASLLCLSLRYVCHILSGVILWGSYAWEGWAVFPYSVAYNGTYMIPEIILTSAAAFLLTRYVPKRYMEPLK